MTLQDAMSEVDLDPESEAGSLCVTSRAERAFTEGREPSGCDCGGWSGCDQQRWRCDVDGAGCPCEGCGQPACAGPVAEAVEEWEESGGSGHTGACHQPCRSWFLPCMHCLPQSMHVSGSTCQRCLKLLNSLRQHWCTLVVTAHLPLAEPRASLSMKAPHTLSLNLRTHPMARTTPLYDRSDAQRCWPRSDRRRSCIEIPPYVWPWTCWHLDPALRQRNFAP